MGLQPLGPVDRPADWDRDQVELRRQALAGGQEVGLLGLGGLLGARPERSRQQCSPLEEGLVGLGELEWLLLGPPQQQGQPVVAA
jgi:hypothetical protein